MQHAVTACLKAIQPGNTGCSGSSTGVDEAHDLRQDTLTSLKRLIETAANGEGKLSVLLAGPPKLRRDLRSPTMEEIDYRATVFSLEGDSPAQFRFR